MKRFTVIFSILLVLCFGGTLAYVAATPDFVPPAAAVPAGQNEDPDAPVWNETMDDLLACLEEKGLISGSASRWPAMGCARWPSRRAGPSSTGGTWMRWTRTAPSTPPMKA